MSSEGAKRTAFGAIFQAGPFWPPYEDIAHKVMSSVVLSCRWSVAWWFLWQARDNTTLQVVYGSSWVERLSHCPAPRHLSKSNGTIHQWKEESQWRKGYSDTWYHPWNRSRTDSSIIKMCSLWASFILLLMWMPYRNWSSARCQHTFAKHLRHSTWSHPSISHFHTGTTGIFVKFGLQSWAFSIKQN